VFSEASQIALASAFALLSLSVVVRERLGLPRPVAIYLPYLWTFFLVFTLAELVSFKAGIWILAILCFMCLREFFTLVDLRIQDRWGMLAAYLAIPFMFYFIQVDWYGMFIISIPVYAFLVVPFAITLGGRETEGTVLSIGAINLGLFLLVYCIGHIGYLARYSVWIAIFLVLCVTTCDLFAYLFKSRDLARYRDLAFQLLAPLPVTVCLGMLLMPWTKIPWQHSIALAFLIPLLVTVGCHTIDHLEADLGIRRSSLRPGRGQVINSVKGFLYVAPVVFHYLRYFLDAF
jgi:phosphatidate cytidylyltransferase